jgi:DNA polymerase-3 subunit alpha
MGKKKPEEMAKQQERFMKGALSNKINKVKAERIFELMAKFAEYGFNKSHSAAYALVAYQTAYLKTHHQTEFMAALLTAEKDNTDKILFYIGDCKSRGIKMLPPDVNESVRDFSVVADMTIRFGLAAVKNVGVNAIESMEVARAEKGPFKSLFDFCDRVDSRKVNKRVVESLLKCGAFDFTGAPRAALLAALDCAMELAASSQRDRLSGQSNIFDAMSEDDSSSKQRLPDVSEWGERQLLAYEKESLGFYITGHPLAQYEQLLSQYATSDSADLAGVGDKKDVKIGGVVSKLREITTKRGDRMGFVTLEDLKGSVEVIVFSDVYAEAMQLIKSDQPIFVVGTSDTDGENTKIIATRIMPIEKVAEDLTRSVHFFLHQPEVTSQHFLQLKNVLSRFPGECPGFIHLVVPDKTETILSLPEDLKLQPSPQLVASVNKLFGHNVTKFIS